MPQVVESRCQFAREHGPAAIRNDQSRVARGIQEIGALISGRRLGIGVRWARGACEGAVAQSEQARDLRILILWAVVGLVASWGAGPLDATMLAAVAERDAAELASAELIGDALSAASQRWAQSARQATAAPWGASRARANFN